MPLGSKTQHKIHISVEACHFFSLGGDCPWIAQGIILAITILNILKSLMQVINAGQVLFFGNKNQGSFCSHAPAGECIGTWDNLGS